MKNNVIVKRMGNMLECFWRPIETAPKDSTPVDLYRSGERLTNMRRVALSKDNVFYEPIHSGPTCVRDASHWMPIPGPPNLTGDM